MNKQISKSLTSAASDPNALGPFRLSPNQLREYGASQTRGASQSTFPLSARSIWMRRTCGKVDIGGLGYG
jgi:hypothetical protein